MSLNPMATEGQANDELSPKFPESNDEDISDFESEPEYSLSSNHPAHSKLRHYGLSERYSKSVNQSEN